MVAVGNATLEELAYDITKDKDNWNLVALDNPNLANFGPRTPVPNGTVVNVQPLLQRLEANLRIAVAAAALAPKYAKFPEGESFKDFTGVMGEDEVKYIFTAKKPKIPSVPAPPIREYDCVAMVKVVLVKGLLDELEPGEFKEFGTVKSALALDTYLDGRTCSIENLKEGDWATFFNNDKYRTLYPTGGWRLENVIKVGTNQYWGFSSNPKPHTYDEWLKVLWGEYNKGLKRWDQIPPDQLQEFIPGYNGIADFWNVSKVGMENFRPTQNEGKIVESTPLP